MFHYCTVHSRGFLPKVNMWIEINRQEVFQLKDLISITEACCDLCIETVKDCMFIQFPELYDQVKV